METALFHRTGFLICLPQIFREIPLKSVTIKRIENEKKGGKALWNPEKIDTGAFALSFSHALDLAEPSLARHQERVAYIVWRMGLEGKVQDKLAEQFFTAALFHDIGALSLKEKRALKNFEIEDERAHCERGYRLLNGSFWLTKVAYLVRHHHRHWEEWKANTENIHNDLVFGAQMIFLADYVERLINRDQCVLFQSEYIRKEIASFSGQLFHNYVVELFMSVSSREEFWLQLVLPGLSETLLTEGPLRKQEMNFGALVPVSELFRAVVDCRSRFTSTHSAGVSAASVKISELFGLTEKEIRTMAVAGNLHDIGKLAIPDSILEKPGRLSKSEKLLINSHVYHTFKILKPVKGLEAITRLTAFHHEKLDGSGYPFHVTGDELDIGSRIMVISDMFTALLEKRPYKKAAPKKDVITILKKEAAAGRIDSSIVSLLADHYDEISRGVAEKQREVETAYEEIGIVPDI